MSTIIYVLLHFNRVGALFRCSGLLLGHCSVFPDTSPKPISALNKGASTINRTLLHTPGLPTWNHSSLAGRCLDALDTHSAPASLPKPLAHIAYTEVSTA